MRDLQYNHKLTVKDAAIGIKAAVQNSRALLSDAMLLFENNRFERAVALAILSIEEAGKTAIIRGIILEEDPKILKKEWQRYRSHTAKNINWIVPDLISKGAHHLDKMRPTVDKNSSHPQVLDNLKQLAFYTDVFSKCKWSSPSEVIDKPIAESILKVAKTLVENGDTGMTTEKQLDLWLKHMKPVWNRDMPTMKKALIECYEECEELGLIEKGVTKRMVGFVL